MPREWLEILFGMWPRLGFKIAELGGGSRLVPQLAQKMGQSILLACQNWTNTKRLSVSVQHASE